MDGQQIANTTAQQLGGYGRLSAMIGAHTFTYDKEGTLTFKFKMCKKANCLKVVYDHGVDLYTVEFYKIGRFDAKIVESMNHVGCEELSKVVQDYTGLYLSL